MTFPASHYTQDTDELRRRSLHGVRNRDLKRAVTKLTKEQYGDDRVTFPAPELRNIVAEHLSVDHRFQRPLDISWVRKIATNFDPDKFRPLLVSWRNMGAGKFTYVIIDGQHRHSAIEHMGWMDQALPCLVYAGLSFEQEAELFASSDDVRKLNRYDMHHASLAAGRPEAVLIDKIVTRFGYQLTPGGKSGNTIKSVAGVYSVLRESSPETLCHILDIFRQAWMPADWQPVESSLKGMRHFLSQYDGTPEFDEKRLIHVLAATPPMDLDREARASMTIMRGSLGTNAARMIEKRYNRGLRTNRIPPWDPPR